MNFSGASGWCSCCDTRGKMLTVQDLLTNDSFPQIEDVSLKLYKDFSKDILLRRRFLYTFHDGSEINVIFTEFGIYHMLGIQHVNGRIPREHFFEEIDNGLSLRTFEANRGIERRYKNIKPRVRFFSCVYQTMRLGEVFYCPSGKVVNRDNVEMDYIVYRNISGKGLNIGIRQQQEGPGYLPLTILVSRQIDPEIYIDRNNVKLVKTLVISDSVTGETIETITHGEGFITTL